MPTATTAMLDQLAVPLDERSLAHLTPPSAESSPSTAESLAAVPFAVKPGAAISKPKGLFPRIELPEDEESAAAAAAAAGDANKAGGKGGQKKAKAPKQQKKGSSKNAA